VSVVIPTRNRAELVAAAVLSCLEQERVELEVIVVDDGGTDETEQRLRAFEGPLRYVRQEWAGRAVARNRGAELAEAPVIGFLDSDDLALPGRFRRQLDRLPGSIASWGQVEIIDVEGRPIEAETVRVQRLLAEAAARGTTPERVALANRLYAGSTLLVTRDVFRRLGGFDPAFEVAEDVELSVRLAREGPLAFEPLPVAAIRHHDGNSRSDEMFEAHVALTAKLVRLCDGREEAPLRARLLADQARAHWSLGDTSLARRSSFAALREDPGVLVEEGFTKRAVGSLLPRPVATRLRELVRRARDHR
jgi:glycosyltransferase involved in cell wall biosynthesis